jgi:hypothetical protein
LHIKLAIKEFPPLPSNKSVSTNRLVSNQMNHNEKNQDSIEEAEIEDEYKVDINDDVNDDSILNKSVISSNILSHINTPKLFSTIKNINDMSYCSSYAKSEFSRTDTFKENEFIVTFFKLSKLTLLILSANLFIKLKKAQQISLNLK